MYTIGLSVSITPNLKIMNKDSSNLWILVVVKAGIPIEIKHFYNEKSAYEYKHKVNMQMNQEEDSVEVFDIFVDKSKIRYATD